MVTRRTTQKLVWWMAYSVLVPSTGSGPIRLLCEGDLIHGNNGDQERWAIDAECRRLGYAGLKPDHEKAVRSFGNSRNVLRACQPWMDSLNASKIAPESLCRWKRFFFLGSSFLGDQNLMRRQIFATKCLRTALSCARVVPHFIQSHILHSYKRYVTIFAIMGNESGMSCSPGQFFSLWWKMVWEWD